MAMVSYAAWLARLAGEAPERPAVTDDERTPTRYELEDLAGRTARAFAACGVQAGDRVTIALPNTAAFLAAAIGCWKPPPRARRDRRARGSEGRAGLRARHLPGAYLPATGMGAAARSGRPGAAGRRGV